MNVSTDTFLPTDEAEKLISYFVSHVEEDHDLEFSRADDGSRFLDSAGFRVEFKAQDAGIRIALSGPSDGMLMFLKEAVAQHLNELDPALGQTLRWSGETAQAGARPENFRVLRVLRVSEALPGLCRVTLHVPDRAFFDLPGQHLKLMLPAIVGRAPVWPVMGENGAPIWPQGEDELHARYMTIRYARAETQEVDLDIATHGGGLISDWANNAQPDQEIGAMGPTGTLMLPDALCDTFLSADLTGLSTVARYLEALVPGQTAKVVILGTSTEAATAYLEAEDASIAGLEDAAAADAIKDALSGQSDETPPKFAFFAGEFEDAQSLRKVFKGTLGLKKGEQLSAPYWRRGHAGFEG